MTLLTMCVRVCVCVHLCVGVHVFVCVSLSVCVCVLVAPSDMAVTLANHSRRDSRTLHCIVSLLLRLQNL